MPFPKKKMPPDDELAEAAAAAARTPKPKPKGKRPMPGAGVPAWKKIAAELERG